MKPYLVPWPETLGNRGKEIVILADSPQAAANRASESIRLALAKLHTTRPELGPADTQQISQELVATLASLDWSTIREVEDKSPQGWIAND